MYKICETQGNILICRQQGYYPVVYKETPEISWETVGVYKEGGLSDDNVFVLKQHVCGKVLRVLNLLITCPINVLREC